jgi:predicted peptidase
MRRQAGLATTLKYWLELPQKVDKVPANGWPLFVLLHGAGERGKTPQHFQGWAGWPRGAKPETFVIAVPACPKDTVWSIVQLDDMISDLTARYPVDTNRIYIAGHSMGGGGSWRMLAAFPDRFAGAIVCAAAMATLNDEAIARIKNVPVWIFHGAKDDAAPVAAAREIVARLERVHGRFRYTENAEDDHGTILGKAFGPVEVYDWLLQQVRGKPTQPQSEPPGEKGKE